MKSKKNELEKEKEYFLKKIEDVKNEREALLNSDELLEKFAREKYFLKKENEDVYIIVEDE